jgi:hypothetical protein
VGLDRDLTARTGPRIYRPVSPLGDYVEFIGEWRSREADYWSRALPRGAVTVIIDVGQRQQLNCYAADGTTRLSVPPAFITGSHSASYVSSIPADEPAMAIHFRPGGGITLVQYGQQRIVLPSHVPVERHKFARPLAA